jgi:hypothetical protein
VSEARYYVYMFRTPSGEPFYVGKGTGNRVNASLKYHARDGNKLKTNVILDILACNQAVEVSIVGDGMTEQDAYDMEKSLITSIGRTIDGSGPLTNLTVGGGGSSGYQQTEDEKSKKSKTHLRKDVADRKKVKLLLYYSDPGNRRRLSEIRRASYQDPEFREKAAAVRVENFSRPEVISKRNQKVREAFERPEVREKLSQSARMFSRSDHGRELRRAAAMKRWHGENIPRV